MLSGVWITRIISPQKAYPRTVRIRLMAPQAMNAVWTAVFILPMSFAPKSLDTTTEAPRLLPTAKAMNITVMG